MGFKHVGKSVIGKNLSEKISAPFIDLDHQIELLYENENNKKYSCRKIMVNAGEKEFRRLETNALSHAVHAPPSVISLGGGTALYPENKIFLHSCFLIYITAPKDIVFNRIQQGGNPAFFNPEENLQDTFNQLWEKRNAIYKTMQNFFIMNDGTVDDTVKKIVEKIKQEELL